MTSKINMTDLAGWEIYRNFASLAHSW